MQLFLCCVRTCFFFFYEHVTNIMWRLPVYLLAFSACHLNIVCGLCVGCSVPNVCIFLHFVHSVLFANPCMFLGVLLSSVSCSCLYLDVCLYLVMLFNYIWKQKLFGNTIYWIITQLHLFILRQLKLQLYILY